MNLYVCILNKKFKAKGVTFLPHSAHEKKEEKIGSQIFISSGKLSFEKRNTQENDKLKLKLINSLRQT